MRLKLISLLAAISVSGLAQADVPAYITFTNNTPLALNSSVAGVPGSGIEPSMTKSVSYSIVSMACFYSGNQSECPIRFSNRDNGDEVATVYINSQTATLTQAPIFHGSYGATYMVEGWEASPISHITISKK